jgi:hypothetical protein
LSTATQSPADGQEIPFIGVVPSTLSDVQAALVPGVALEKTLPRLSAAKHREADAQETDVSEFPVSTVGDNVQAPVLVGAVVKTMCPVLSTATHNPTVGQLTALREWLASAGAAEPQPSGAAASAATANIPPRHSAATNAAIAWRASRRVPVVLRAIVVPPRRCTRIPPTPNPRRIASERSRGRPLFEGRARWGWPRWAQGLARLSSAAIRDGRTFEGSAA